MRSEVESLVMRCLSMERSKRPMTARELAAIARPAALDE